MKRDGKLVIRIWNRHINVWWTDRVDVPRIISAAWWGPYRTVGAARGAARRQYPNRPAEAFDFRNEETEQ